MQALILAAGMGTRIREVHEPPKGFICLGKYPIVQESIHQLRSLGVDDIFIVTGYCAHDYDALAQREKNIRTILNASFDCFGSLFSLYCAKSVVTQDFLLLESDIIYETRAIKSLLQDTHANAILVSNETHSGDEVYVESQSHQLIRMSKQKNQLSPQHIEGEFVGISKITLTDYCDLIKQLEQDHALLQFGHYDEQGLVAIAQKSEIFCLKIPDLLWSEIDNDTHLKRAKKLYPLIQESRYEKQHTYS